MIITFKHSAGEAVRAGKSTRILLIELPVIGDQCDLGKCFKDLSTHGLCTHV